MKIRCLLFLFSLLRSTVGQLGPAFDDDSLGEGCEVEVGWTYSSKASGGCTEALSPSECIKTGEECQWCEQEDFSGARCNTEMILRQQGCQNLQIVRSKASLDVAVEENRFNHQQATASIRAGGSVNVPFRIREPEIYPVDLYYLMDTSYSMKDDLQSVKQLAVSLVEELKRLTKGDADSVKLGFGKFVDKVQTPITQLTAYRLQHPYGTGNETEAPFLFKNVINLTSDVVFFGEVLDKQKVSGNLDPPEGALEAMLQATQCTNLIGWRDDALRLLLVATESAFHYGGDGAGYLTGLPTENDGQCHTRWDGIYNKAELQDYPTVEQVVAAMESKSITPIFAVGKQYLSLYEGVSRDAFRGSTVGELEGDSSNIVELVKRAYLDITGKQELVTSNPNEQVICPWFAAIKPNGEYVTRSWRNTLIQGLKSGSTVYYNMTLSANREACAGQASCHVGNVVVKTRRYDDRLRVNTSVVAAFDCESKIEVNSPSCSGNGNFSCGICTCGLNYTGVICEDLNVPVDCRCSGRGVCINNKCQCDPGYRHNKEKIYGTNCECDDCFKTAGLVCSGNGEAVKGGPNNCSCECQCFPGWTGDNCECANTNVACAGIDGLSCSGRGECICGACECNLTSGYGGPTCSDCISNCPTCLKFQDCIQCTVHKTGPLNQTCGEDCPGLQVNLNSVYSLDEENLEEGAVLCAAIDETDNCKFYYTYKEGQEGMVYRAEDEKRCKPVYSLLIILWCFLIFLLIGLILLCCWRCCVYIIDKEEERAYYAGGVPGLVPLLPTIGASSLMEFIKAKYLVRRSAKVAVIPVRRSFYKGDATVLWKTYPGSSMDDELEVLSVGEEGTTLRKKKNATEKLVVHGKAGDSEIEIEPVQASGLESTPGAGFSNTDGGSGLNGRGQDDGARAEGYSYDVKSTPYATIDERTPLINQPDWGDGSVKFKDGEEFANIEIPLLHDFGGKEISFWVELYGQEKGVALGLKRTKVIVIKDEVKPRKIDVYCQCGRADRTSATAEAGIIGFPKPNYVFKENDGFAVVPVHRTVGMDGKVQASWFTRDITARDGEHYQGGRGIVVFNDGEVTQNIQVPLIPNVHYDENDKAFNIILEEPKGGASLDLSHCMVTMLCDEECSLVQFAKDAYPFMENCGTAEVSVLRTRNTRGVSRVRWYTEDDTAIAGKDYEATEGEITFPDAATEAHISVRIIDNDEFDDSGRAFRIVLTDPSDGTKLTHNVATISIIEDDEPGLFEFSKTNLVMRSKTTLGRLSVIRSLGSDGHVVVPWCIQPHENVPVPSDVLSMHGLLDFRTGEISKQLELNLNDVKSSEQINFDVILQQPTASGKLGAKSRANVTVFAEEDLGTVSFAQSRFDVTATAGVATLLVSRRGDVSGAAFVMCDTSDQSAISGTHYRGGTNSVVFDAGESVKEVGIPIYNQSHDYGQVQFKVTLKSPPGGPKTGSPSEAEVVITFVAVVPISPVHQAPLMRPPGQCVVEFIKATYLTRRSTKVIILPVRRSSPEGGLLVEWVAHGPPQESVTTQRWPSVSSSSSSSSEDESDGGWGSGTIHFAEGEESGCIELSLLNRRNISTPQISIKVELVGWKDDATIDDEIRFGLKETEVVVLNDIDPGTLGFSKASFTFNEGDGKITIPIHRLGGMDGEVSAKWRTVEGNAIEGEDYEGGKGVVTFAHNQVAEPIHLRLLVNPDGEEEDKKFSIELYKFTGGAKPGLRRSTVMIVGDKDTSVVQFSKPAYPVIGTSTSVKLPVLRTGSAQRRVAVLWRTEDGTAKKGVDYRESQNLLVFEPGETKNFVEIALSGKAQEAREFLVRLEPAHQQSQFVFSGDDMGKVTLGSNKCATVSIISSQDPGVFEFSKPSFVFKTSGNTGVIPVIRSGGADGEVIVPWTIESLDKPSIFEGAGGSLEFQDGQVATNIEINLEGVPTDEFAIALLPPQEGEDLLGATKRATITIIGQTDEPVIEMGKRELMLKDAEIVEIPVVREGNLEEATYVGWRTVDGEAVNGIHFMGGDGNLVFDPDQSARKIIIPIMAPPSDGLASFSVQLTEVRGAGKLSGRTATSITLEPAAKPIVPQVVHDGLQTSAPAATVVEFLRKRYLFRQSQGSALIPVRRSRAHEMLVLHWITRPINDDIMTQQSYTLSDGTRSPRSPKSPSTPKSPSYGSEDDIDWGSGTLTFEEGEHEANIEIVVCREMAHCEASFRIDLEDPADRAEFAVPSTNVTVIRDKDPGILGFGSPRYNFSCSDPQLVIPVHRSSGADGAVALPWFTRDSTAVGGLHYLPGDGNLIFGDGEVLKKIVLPMPKRVEYFSENEVAFILCLGEPTGGASLSVAEAYVVLQNDIVPSRISFLEPNVKCAQSNGILSIPVQRFDDVSGIANVSWLSRGAPNKESIYDGTNGNIVFADGEREKAIKIKLPPHVQPTATDSFIVTLEKPTTGCAMLGDYPQCSVVVDNDILPGAFSLEGESYNFLQSKGRDKIRVLRRDGDKGAVSLPWKILPASDDSQPSLMHDLHGSVDFKNGQNSADVIINFPPDSLEDEENCQFVLLPPEGRAILEEPYKADITLRNDVKCKVGFTKPSYDVRGSLDTLLVPVRRSGPKGRPVSVAYKTKDGSAVDCTHYIGAEGELVFDSGEDEMDVLVPIINDTSGARVFFTIELSDVQGPGQLGTNSSATVHIDNVPGHGVVEMGAKEATTKQSLKEIRLVVLRKNGSKGPADVPWFVEKVDAGQMRVASPGPGGRTDNYEQLEGSIHFKDGENEKELVVPLTQKPQDDDVTIIDVSLLTPTSGGGVTLGDVTSTKVVITNDIDGGVMDFESDTFRIQATKGELRVPVIRTGPCGHPCQVTWEAEDGSALRGKHYRAGKGSLAFVPNESRKEICLPLINDPSADTNQFTISLGNPKGGIKLGAKSKAQILIQHAQEPQRMVDYHQRKAPEPKLNVHGIIGFGDPFAEVKQSTGEAVITLHRQSGTRGRIVVPWSVESEASPSPYSDLHGQETFKDGENESHINIELPQVPQDVDLDSFKIILGQPTGGASLSDHAQCSVTVVNDVVHGVIFFRERRTAVRQSDQEVVLEVERINRTKGKVRVPWKSSSKDPQSPFANLSGIETFEDGESLSRIHIPISQEPREKPVDEFSVTLVQPKISDAVLGEKSSCVVNVNNDIAPGLITFDQPSHKVLQSKGKLPMKVSRLQSSDGRVIVPWKVVPDSPDSVYVGLVGETVLGDGDEHGVVEIPLPPTPLSNSSERVTVMLEEPVGGTATLADEAMASVEITHDIGEGLVELRSREMTCVSDDGDASVIVLRKLGHDFATEVTWSTRDGDALAGDHYTSEGGKLKFKPGEVERTVHIPLVNDPTGETRHFFVTLDDIKGRDNLGDVTTCKIKIASEAMPPNVVEDFDADLVGPHSVRARWLPPTDGAPVDGYKVTYWGRPGSAKTMELPHDATSVQLDDLQPNTSYQVNVRPVNSVGDGPASETLMVETQPELRLSYHTPVQVRTSEGAALLNLKRNVKEFRDVITWRIVKDVIKKSRRSTSSSSHSSSSSFSSSDQSLEESPNVVCSGEVEFPPGHDQLTVEYPLKQNMRHAAQKLRFIAHKKPRDGEEAQNRPLANIELNVINDTGYPGRVRKPLVSSASPFEATVLWEAAPSGIPVDGYKIVAQSSGEPDVVADVGADKRKVTLTGLRPSTEYQVTVQPYNRVGLARPSIPAHVTTQDEMKIEFSERFYTFKSSDKTAVIPIKRHFNRGYASLNWDARWCARHEDEASSSESEDDVPRTRPWATGSVAFQDGADTAEVRIPLQQANPPVTPKMKSYFWLNVVDPNKHRKLASMRVLLVDDRERGLIGFEGSIVIVEGGNEALNVVPLPLMRVEGSYSQIAVKWQATAPLEFDYLLLAGCGEAAFNDGDTLASIPIELIPDWVESCTQPVSIKCELTQAHGGASLHHHHQVCELRLLPAERGVIRIKPKQEVIEWKEGNCKVLIDVAREGGSYGSVYLQWKLIGKDVDLFFQHTRGELHLANGETQGLITLTCFDSPFIEERVEAWLKATVVTTAVELGDEDVPITIIPHRGVVSFHTNSHELRWPLKDDCISLDVTRDDAKGPVRISWTVSKPQAIKDNSTSNYASRLFPALTGTLTLESGKSFSELQIPVNKTEVGPEENIELQIKLQPLSEGLQVKEDAVKLVLKQHKPGIVELSSMPGPVDLKVTNEAVLKLKRRGGNQGDVHVTYVIHDVTTVAGVHYAADAVSGNILFRDGGDEERIRIPLLQAEHPEPVEFKIKLLETTGGAGISEQSETVVTLKPTYVEPPSTARFDENDVICEKTSQSDVAVVMLRRHGGTRGALRVRCSTEDESAIAGTHYEATEQEVVFEDGEESKEFCVKLLPAKYQSDLRFNINLSRCGKSQSFVANKFVQLSANHHPGTLFIAEQQVNPTAQAQTIQETSLMLPVSRQGGSDGQISLRYRVRDGTAKEGVHYKVASRDVTLNDKEISGNIQIVLLPALYRNELDFYLDLDGHDDGSIQSKQQSVHVTLLPTDTEPAGEIKFEQKTMKVAGKLPQDFMVPIKRVKGVGGPISVVVETENGRAKEGIHYQAKKQTIELADRQVEGSIQISIFESLHGETLEFYVNICEVIGEASVGDVIQTKILLPPTVDTNPGVVQFAADGAESLLAADAKKEKIVKIPIKRVGGKYGKLCKDYRTVDGSALAGVHYQAAEGTITFEENEIDKFVEVVLLPVKYRKEVDFGMVLDNSNQDQKSRSNTILIKLDPTDDEPPGKIILPDEAIKVAAEVNEVVFVPLRRVNGAGGEVSVKVKTKDGSAVDGVHYKGLDGVVTLKDRQECVEVPITINPDKCEHPVSFSVEISDPEGGVILPKNASINVLVSSKEKPLQIAKKTVLQQQTKEVLESKNKIHVEPLVTIPPTVSVFPIDSSISIPISRPLHEPDSKVSVRFKTKPGSAKPGKHYVDTAGEVQLQLGEEKARAVVGLIKSKHSKPLDFTVEFQQRNTISNVKVHLKPTIKNSPGKLGFKQPEITFSSPREIGVNDVASVAVIRRDGSGGEVEVYYSCRDNTAIAGKHYIDTRGKLTFDDGQIEKFINVQLMPQIIYSNERSFFVELGAASGGADVAGIYETEVTLEAPLDESDPGYLGFETPDTYYTNRALRDKNRKELEMLIPLRRTYGCGGLVGVDYSLRDNTAVAGKHYTDDYGEMTFENKEISKSLPVQLIPGKHFTKPVTFTAELGGTSGGAEVGIYETVIHLDPDLHTDSSFDESSSSSSSRSSSCSSSSDDKHKRTIITEAVSMKEYEYGMPSEIGFAHENNYVTRGVDAEVAVPVLRSFSDRGRMEIGWATREHSAEAGKDFVDGNGLLVFEEGQTEATIHIPLLHPSTRGARELSFIVELGNVDGDASVGRYETNVHIRPPSSETGEVRLIAPQNVRTVINNATCVSVTWEPQEAQVHEYLVSYKRAGSKEEPTRHTVPSSEHSLTIDGLIPESAYAIVVSALGEGGQQVSSDVIGCKMPGRIPGPPNRLVFQVLSPTSLNCAWGEPAITNGLITGYEVVYKPTDESLLRAHPPTVVKIPDGHFRSLLVENLLEDIAYLYSVRAQNKSGLGAPREATMKIEHIGSRPPSAVFLDEENMKIVQQQIELEEAQRQERIKSRSSSTTSNDPDRSRTRVSSQRLQSPTLESTSSNATKTRVTRYIHKDGQSEPEVETTEYDGRLSKDEINQLAADSQRIEVQVISYNTTRTQSSGGYLEGGATSPTSQVRYVEGPPTSPLRYDIHPIEYSNTDVQRDVSRDTAVTTDVQESKEGDTEVTTITKTYQTTTTERRLETTSGMKPVASSPVHRQRRK